MDEILSRKNSEGYTDMTAYKAILSADGFDYRPLVYICSPYSGDIKKNTNNARRYCRYAVDKGVIPMGERLGRFIGQYRTAYFRPDRTNGQIVYSYKPLPGAQEQIYDKVSDITISMRAEEHLAMPELISNEYPVFMANIRCSVLGSAPEKKTYLPCRRS